MVAISKKQKHGFDFILFYFIFLLFLANNILTLILQLDLVNVSYNVVVGKTVKRLLLDVNLHVNAGDLCAVMGPSGSGKRSLKIIQVFYSSLVDFIIFLYYLF
jgi:ABC-type multidrug transport system fused ATPase/permease subunit